jgi:protoporphyrin/coproporphyrin ferrochelatase
MADTPEPYDALLLVSFGGPEGPEDVLPFLENVTRGKNIPADRLRQVAERYQLWGGISPINEQNRAMLAALVAELNAHGPQLAVYWGNRNWHPLLADVLAQMAEDGIRNALALVTSAFGSYPGCRQYSEDIDRAWQEVGQSAPRVDKLRLYYNHPGFVEAMADRVWDALEELPAERRPVAELIFTAHSLPLTMARTSPYQSQLAEAGRLVAERLGRARWHLAYQSRSGRPSEPWLEPTLDETLRKLAGGKSRDVVLAPIGFVCEHMEVVYDLDVDADRLCQELGLNMVRSGVVACHARFIKMIRELVLERMTPSAERLSLGKQGPWPDQCPNDCCKQG